MKTLVEQEQFGVGRIKSSNHCTIGEDLEKHVRRCVGEIKEPFDHTRCFYGVGNHGGGPTRKCTESILRLNADPEFPEVTFDTPDGFFERASTSGLPFPTVHDELQHHAVGCYSAHSGAKRLNRRAENALNLAEKFCSAAQGVTGQ